MEPFLGQWLPTWPLTGLVLVCCACWCAAIVVYVLLQGRRHPFVSLGVAVVCFVVMMGFLHDAFILIEPFFP